MTPKVIRGTRSVYFGVENARMAGVRHEIGQIGARGQMPGEGRTPILRPAPKRAIEIVIAWNLQRIRLDYTDEVIIPKTIVKKTAGLPRQSSR